MKVYYGYVLIFYLILSIFPSTYVISPVLSNSDTNLYPSVTIDEVIKITTTEFHEAFPSVIEVQNGDLIVVYRNATNHNYVNGGIYANYFTNINNSWSSPFLILNSSMDNRDPSIMKLSNGYLILSYFTYNWTLPRSSSVMFLKSLDNGFTWSEPIELPKIEFGIDNLAISDRILEYGNQLIASCYSNGTIFIFRTDYNFYNWELISSFNSPDENVIFSEPSTIILENKLFTFIRTGLRNDSSISYLRIVGLSNFNFSGYNILSLQDKHFMAVGPNTLNLNNKFIFLTYGLREEMNQVRGTIFSLNDLDYLSTKFDKTNIRSFSIFNMSELIVDYDVKEIPNYESIDVSYPSTIQLANKLFYTVFYFEDPRPFDDQIVGVLGKMGIYGIKYKLIYDENYPNNIENSSENKSNFPVFMILVLLLNNRKKLKKLNSTT